MPLDIIHELVWFDIPIFQKNYYRLRNNVLSKMVHLLLRNMVDTLDVCSICNGNCMIFNAAFAMGTV